MQLPILLSVLCNTIFCLTILQIPVGCIIVKSSKSACAMTMPAWRGHNMPMSSVHSKTRSRLICSFFIFINRRWKHTMMQWTKHAMQWNNDTIIELIKIEAITRKKSSISFRIWTFYKKIVVDCCMVWYQSPYPCMLCFVLLSVKGSQFFIMTYNCTEI